MRDLACASVKLLAPGVILPSPLCWLLPLDPAASCGWLCRSCCAVGAFGRAVALDGEFLPAPGPGAGGDPLLVCAATRDVLPNSSAAARGVVMRVVISVYPPVRSADLRRKQELPP